MKNQIANLCLIAIVAASLAPCQAQKASNKSNPRATTKAKEESGLSKFPGIGNIDDWRVSRPEALAGNQCMREKRWDDAIRHYKASLTLYQYQPHAWIEIGRATENRGGDIKDAEECYRKALKLDANNWHTWKLLANVLYVEKRYDESREALADSLQLNVPAEHLGGVQNMVKKVDSALHNADTSGQNTIGAY